MANVEANIKKVFKDFKDIFENWDGNYPPMKKLVGKDSRIMVYIPKKTSISDSSGLDGINLKNGVGVIAIRQELDKSGTTISYTYKFISSEYEHLICKKKCQDNTVVDFYFHFDKCEEDKPHEPHITVINPSIRYISRDIKLDEFLEFIRCHFYSQSGGDLVKRDGNIWDSRYV